MKCRLLAVATAVGIVAGCGHGGASSTVALPFGRHANGDDLTEAVRALCDTADQARTDPAKAGSAFYLRSHNRLHTLAQALGPQAAPILEAMCIVEQDIAETPPLSGLATDLSSLATLAGSGLIALHLSAPTCTTRTHP